MTALALMIFLRGATYLVASEWLPPDRPITTLLLILLPVSVLLSLLTWHLPAPSDCRRLGALLALNVTLVPSAPQAPF